MGGKQSKTLEERKSSDAHGSVSQYCKIGRATKCILQTQNNLYEKSNFLLYRNREIILKFIWKHKRLRVAEPALNGKSNVEDITVPELRPGYRATGTK